MSWLRGWGRGRVGWGGGPSPSPTPSYLTLPYLEDFSSLAAYNNVQVHTVQPDRWQINGLDPSPLVANTSLADNAGRTPTGQLAILRIPTTSNYTGMYVFPYPTLAGLPGIRFSMLRRATWDNRMRAPYIEFSGHNSYPTGATETYFHGYAHSDSNPNSVYLSSRYTVGGAFNTEMFNSAITSVLGTTLSGQRWSWRDIEFNFTASTVRVQVRDYGAGILYYRQQAMHANGIAAGSMPSVRSAICGYFESGLTSYIARIWVGSLTDAWPT